MQRLEPGLLDLTCTHLADSVETLVETLQALLNGDEFVLRGVVDNAQGRVVLHLDGPIGGILRQRVVVPLQVVPDPIVSLFERRASGQERVPDFAEVGLGGHGTRSLWPGDGRKIAGGGQTVSTGRAQVPQGISRVRFGVGSGRLGLMTTPIRVGNLLDYSRPESRAQVTDRQTQDPGALLEQLLQVARISALEEMASGIAHELNQPIGAITTFAQAGRRMLDRPEPLVGPATEVLQHISSEALNAGEGIRRIRSLFHGHHAERTGCNLADVIAELMPILELLASRRGATLEFLSRSSLPEVAIDRLRIQHVLFTLVQNALEAPTRDGVPPDVRIEVAGDRYGASVAVEDRGVGIPTEARGQLFRPFYTTKAQGTGLGLASSRAIAELHEGSLDVEDVAGGGTRFCLRLPATADSEEVGK